MIVNIQAVLIIVLPVSHCDLINDDVLYVIVFCVGEIKEKTVLYFTILEQVCCMENTVQWLANTA